MAKYTLFHPKNQIEQDEPKNDVLWRLNFNLKTEDKVDFKIYVYDLFEDSVNDCFPLPYLEKSMNELGMEKIYDFPFKKEYSFVDQNGLEIIATLTALDLNGFDNGVKLTKKLADVLLKDMKLPTEGELHPERFMRKLSTYIDLSDKKYDTYERNFDSLLELENLCDKCLQYETNIQWQLINEVVK